MLELIRLARNETRARELAGRLSAYDAARGVEQSTSGLTRHGGQRRPPPCSTRRSHDRRHRGTSSVPLVG
jgi:hypothetical protein